MNRAKEIRFIVEKYRRLLGHVNGDAASVLAVEGRALEEKILAEILKRSGKMTPAEVQSVRALLRDLVAGSSKRAALLMSRYVTPSMKLTAARTYAATSALLRVIAHPRMREVLGLAQSYATKIEDRALVQTPFYQARWRAAWNRQWSRVVGDVGREMERGALSRDGWEVTAKRILRLADLPDGGLTPAGALANSTIAGHMHGEAFARGFVRTEIGQLAQTESINEAHEIGLAYFVNMGVSDDRQSEICADASNAGPMTGEEWARWRRDPADPSNDGGPPLRHVFNCRCELIGVPAQMLKDDWSQPNPAADSYRYKYAGDYERTEVAA